VDILGRLNDEREIGRLITQLARAQDAKDRDAYRRCFTDAIEIDMPTIPGWQPTTMPSEEWADRAISILAGFDATHHRLSNLLIDVDGDTASASVDVSALHWVQDAEPDTLTIGGRYRMSLERSGTGWLISRRAMEIRYQIGNPDLMRKAVDGSEPAAQQRSTRHLVDPTFSRFLAISTRFQADAQSLPAIREIVINLRKDFVSGVDDVLTLETVIPGPPGAPDVHVLLTRPADAPAGLPAVLWMHGGGFVAGTARNNIALIEQLASEMRCAFVSVDYRLAPEAPYPAAIDDGYAALTWIAQGAGELAVDPARIVVAGESAGAGMAAGLALLARDRGEIGVCFQALVYPMLDDRSVTRLDQNPWTGEFIWTRKSNRFGWTSWLGQEPGGPDVPVYASPARATDLSGLPPAFIDVGMLDLSVDEDIDYAHRLMRAGVPTELHVRSGAFHGYLSFDFLPTGLAVQRDLKNALRRVFGSQAG